jgi:hypothetical protein
VSLYQLLDAIRQGKPINSGSLYKALPDHINTKEIFGEHEMVAKNKYIVEIVDQQRFEALLAQSRAPTTRAEAASHTLQSSHYVACDSSYMLCFPVNSYVSSLDNLFKQKKLTNTDAPEPKFENIQRRNLLTVATIRRQILPMLFKPAKHAILIENQDCFFDWETLIQHFVSTLNESECDIYFAGGKRVLNTAFAPFLSKYDTLYCAFDYDLDGLKMARSLIRMNYADTRVLLPDNLVGLHSLFTFKPTSTKRFLESLEVCEDMNLLKLHEVISETQHFMEQEALLNNALYSDKKDV